MADYREITKQYPEMADFLRNQARIRPRGDVLAYAANISAPSFSTDAQGFRHTMFGGENLSVADCVRSERYGVVLGASNSFGFGLAGNENCMASLLSARFGMPFANCAMPGATSRNLHSLLVSVIASAPRPPSTVVLSSGGDLVTFCDASTADPVFGSPNRNQVAAEFDKGRELPDPEPYLRHMLDFTSMWAEVIARTCRRQGASLAMIHQSTFFEKSEPTAQEIEFRLGVPFNVHHERMFANHRRFNIAFFARRKAVADHLQIPLVGWGAGPLGFIDEFHLDRESTRALSERAGDEIEALVKASA